MSIITEEEQTATTRRTTIKTLKVEAGESKAKTKPKTKKTEAKLEDKALTAETEAQRLERERLEAEKAKNKAKRNKQKQNRAFKLQNEAQCVDYLNKCFAKVTIKGKTKVVRISPVYQSDAKTVDYFSTEEFKKLFLSAPQVNIGIDDDDINRYKPQYNVWLQSPRSNNAPYGPIFNPREAPLSIINGYFNLWQGFAVKESKKTPEQLQEDKNLSVYLRHIKNIICSGNEEYYKKLIQFLAHMFQKPWQKPHFAVVLRSGQGTGKGVFVNPLMTILGDAHATIVVDFNGKFNAIFSGKLFIFGDDAHACSKEASTKMKGVVTEPKMVVEHKNIDSFTIDNYLRLIFATNEDAMIRIDKDERRYFFLAVSEEQKQNRAYFRNFSFASRDNPQEHTAFCSDLLSYLLAYDISDFDPYSAPKTEELARQKVHCFDNEWAFIYEMLCTGYNGRVKKTFNYQIATEELREVYLQFLTEGRRKYSYGNLAKRLGSVLKKIGVTKTTNSPKMYKFPDLKKCRELFQEETGVSDFDSIDDKARP